MKIVVAGGTGFIGETLVRALQNRGDVVVLSRNPAKVRAGRGVHWDPTQGNEQWRGEVDQSDVVINLAGENIGAGRWTAERKRQLVDSRIRPTRAIVGALTSARDRVLVNASAVGYYGSRGDEVLDENSASGDDFLANLCKQWEAAAREAEGKARVAILRFGVVLGPGGGALPKMALPFRLFAGGPVGNGQQWMSWVDRSDVIRAIEWMIDHRDVWGAFNVSSPNPVRNREFAKSLGSVLRRPSIFPAPAPMLRLALGEMADEMLLASQRAIPRRLEQEGFTFEFPMVRSSLEHALR